MKVILIRKILIKFVKRIITTVLELKKKLIGKINQTENNELLEVMFRLITEEDAGSQIYDLSSDQISAVEEWRLQFENGQF